MERISGRQLIIIGAMFTFDATLVSVISQAIMHGKQHVYLSVIIAFLVILLSVWLLSKVMNRFPEKDLYQALIDRMPIVGRIIAMSYIVFFFFIMARDIRMLVDFSTVSLLPSTPIAVIAGLVVFTSLMIARGGVEILARMAEIWGPILIMVILLIPLILFKEFDMTLIMPYMAFDIPGILQGSWFYVAYFGEVVGVFLLFGNKDFKFKFGWIGLAIGSLVILVLTMSVILILGAQLAGRVMYPSYELVRQLRITDFLDRFDLPLVGIWMPTMLTKIAFSLYIVCHGIKRIFPSVSAKTIVTPMSVFAYVCSLWFFHNAIQIYIFNETLPLIALIFQLFIPILLFFILKPKRRQTAPNVKANGT